jgi:hypothetical protein
MGRYVTQGGHVTNAERQARFRKKREAERQAELERLRAQTNGGAELQSLRQRVAALGAENAALKAAKPKAQRAPTLKPAAPPTDKETRLKNTVRELRKKLRTLTEWHEQEMKRNGRMPQKTFTAVVKCLHPDQPPPTPEQRTEACSLFTQWKRDQDQSKGAV